MVKPSKLSFENRWNENVVFLSGARTKKSMTTSHAYAFSELIISVAVALKALPTPLHIRAIHINDRINQNILFGKSIR
jgi:hypothetical protein